MSGKVLFISGLKQSTRSSLASGVSGVTFPFLKKNPKFIYLAALVHLNKGQERTDLEQFQSAFSVLGFGEGISRKRGQIQALQSISVV